MHLSDQTRIIFRMTDNTRLLERIEALRLKTGLSGRQLSIRATGKPDAIRQLERGHKPTRVRLRAFALLLGCDLVYLEEVASDIRIDSQAGDARELVDLYDSVPEERRTDFIEGARHLGKALKK